MQGAQPEVAESVVGAGVDQRVQTGRVELDEGGGAVGDQAFAVPGRDRPGERGDALRGGLGADGEGQQPGGEPGVGGVLGDQPGGRLGGQFPQLRLVGGGGPGRAARRRPPGRGRRRAGRRSAGSGSAAARHRDRRSPRSRGSLKPDRLARWSRVALPRSARGPRRAQGAVHERTGRRVHRPIPRGPDVRAPGPEGPGALSAGPRTDSRARPWAGMGTPLRDSSGFAPDSPATTASTSIHLVPGVADGPICCVARGRCDAARKPRRSRTGGPGEGCGGAVRASARRPRA